MKTSKLLLRGFLRDEQQAAFVFFVFGLVRVVSGALSDLELPFNEVLDLMSELLLERLAEAEEGVDLEFVGWCGMRKRLVVPGVVYAKGSVLDVRSDEAAELVVVQ